MPFKYGDYVQHLNPYGFQNAIEKGECIDRNFFVPYGVNIEHDLIIPNFAEKENLRHMLNLPEKQTLIISVGAVNKYHKRMDYIIRELSSLPRPRPYLLLIGQEDRETPEISCLGNRLLGADSFRIINVRKDQLDNYYKIADIFVLASLRETFGRASVEAMARGLPCLAHDYEINRFILGGYGYLADFTLNGSLTDLLSKLPTEHNRELALARHRFVYERFSWDKLRVSYANLFRSCFLNF